MSARSRIIILKSSSSSKETRGVLFKLSQGIIEIAESLINLKSKAHNELQGETNDWPLHKKLKQQI